MTDWSVTANRMEPGGDRWILGGTLEKDESAVVLDTAVLQAAILQHYQVAPATSSATYVHAAITMPEAGTTVVTTAITNPDVPRNVTVKGNAVGIAGDVVIAGTNIADEAITETIALSGSSEVAGVKAFKTVTSITIPVRNAEADTVSIGVSKKVGVPHIVYNAGCYLLKLWDGSTDAGTPTVDDDEVEKNVYSIAGTPNGARVLDLWYLV